MSAAGHAGAPDGRVVDYDLHGVVGVRVVDGTPAEAAAVGAHLGHMVRPLARIPDIVVRFVADLPAEGLRYVEVGRSGYTERGFLVLSHRRRPVRVLLPMEEPGPGVEVVCQRGVRTVPYMDALVKLVALRNGYVPVHASAFSYEGAGVLVAGRAHGGKTSSLLAFAESGAAFVADDMVLLAGDGREMLGLPSPIAVAGWQLDQLPGGRGRVGRTRRLLLAAARGLARLPLRQGPGSVGDAIRAAVPAVQRRLRVSLAPESLFRQVGPFVVEPRTVFLSMSQAADEVRVEPADPETVADRLAVALHLELLPYFEQYLAYRFAFPERRHEWLETAEANAARLLRGALEGKDVFLVRHPHPVSLRELHRAMRPYVAARRVSGSAALLESR